MKHLHSLILALLSSSFAFSQVTSILLDYDAVDEIAKGVAYDREFWPLNARLPDANTERGLTWAVVKFDTLYNADSAAAYAWESKQVTIDSVRVLFTHENVSGNPDTVVIRIYEYQGATGLVVDSQEQIANTVLYDTMIITTASLTGSLAQVGTLTLRPDLQLAAGQKFLTGVHFYGDLSNTFNLISGYGDLCGSACFDPSASPSVFESNSFYRIIYWEGPVRFTGVNSVLFDCDGDTVAGEPDECELFTIQNLAFQAYVTFTDSVATSPADVVQPPSVKVYPNPADDFVTVEFTDMGKAPLLTLYNGQGRKLLWQTQPSGQKIDLSGLPKGLYFLEITGKGQYAIRKFVRN